MWQARKAEGPQARRWEEQLTGGSGVTHEVQRQRRLRVEEYSNEYKAGCPRPVPPPKIADQSWTCS